ncbi:MAG: transcription elongation factor subunit Spt4 [Candidatus Hydrothermarchaeota archaeon]|jgi:DNA-directed RNA polymerase subunit E"|nr:transcription elongation factor subunit Spt4 [Candidatus Hydrothermarchaeota archaeon]
MKEKACKECSRVTELDVCVVCKTPTSPNWMGYVSVIDPEKSEVAKKLNIAAKGRYALRVR